MTGIKLQIQLLIEQLPISQQNDYEIAMLGIELQELLRDQCMSTDPAEVDKIQKRIEAFNSLIELREQTKKLLEGLSEEQQSTVLGRSKALKSIIHQNRKKNENQDNPEANLGKNHK